MKLIQWKVDFGISERAFDQMAGMIRDLIGGSNRIPSTYRQTKRIIKELALDCKRIDVCPEGCLIYYGSDEGLTHCRICGLSRYKEEQHGEKDRRYKRISKLQMFYLPIIPRLQRLFMTESVGKHMSWHARGVEDPQKMIHPSDGIAWKHFDQRHPDFAAETRNVRLGLCSDGFSPFGMSVKSYSCWPVMLTPYNLPPWMCMTPRFMWLSIMIPGPKNPKRRIDIYLRPLIDDLQILWREGIQTYDKWNKQNFNLRACLFWTISDFPAYGMLSGWTTQGRLGCPYCMEDTKTFQLQHGRKPCYFDCHRRFLPPNHPYRSNKRAFLKNRTEEDPPIPYRSGHDILHRIQHFPDIYSQSANDKLPGYGETHNWTKKSIFWELPYWPDLLIRHNLDVMHIEKNVFDNLFNTMMGVKGKSKDDGFKCRKDVQKYCRRPELELRTIRGRDYAAKAKYCLEDTDKLSVCRWLKSLEFPDGYASQLGRSVDEANRKLVGYKSHDAHVILERLMQIAFKGFLPTDLWEAVAELCTFFRDCCGSALDINRMTIWRDNIAKTLCKLEMYFPPSFFDSMEHLPIHVAEEVLLGGPVQYRWMYPFERFIFRLKEMATNKSRIEPSIVFAYLNQETSYFGSDYLDPSFQTNSRMPRRNEIIGNPATDNTISIFNYPGSGGRSVQRRELTTQEFLKATHYILTNTPEVDEYYNAYKSIIVEHGQASTITEVEDLCVNDFPEWFHRQVWSESGKHSLSVEWLLSLANGFDWKVTCYDKYKVNNYRFHTESFGKGRRTTNCHVHVKGDAGKHYYGVVEEILSVRCRANHQMQVVLFKCRWYDPEYVLVDATHGITEVNVNRLYTVYDPFILAQQAEQVYFTYFPGLPNRTANGWMAVCRVKPTNTIDMAAADNPFQYEVDDDENMPTIQEVRTVGSLADTEINEIQSTDFGGIQEEEGEENYDDDDEDYNP